MSDVPNVNNINYFKAGQEVYIWWITYDKETKKYDYIVRKVLIVEVTEHGFVRTNDPGESDPRFNHLKPQNRIYLNFADAQEAADKYLYENYDIYGEPV